MAAVDCSCCMVRVACERRHPRARYLATRRHQPRVKSSSYRRQLLDPARLDAVARRSALSATMSRGRSVAASLRSRYSLDASAYKHYMRSAWKVWRRKISRKVIRKKRLYSCSEEAARAFITRKQRNALHRWLLRSLQLIQYTNRVAMRREWRRMRRGVRSEKSSLRRSSRVGGWGGCGSSAAASAG